MNTEIIIDTLKNASIEIARLVGEVTRLKQENELLTKVAEASDRICNRDKVTVQDWDNLRNLLSAWRKWKEEM